MNTAFNNVLALLASRLLTLFWQNSHKTYILGQHNYMHELLKAKPYFAKQPQQSILKFTKTMITVINILIENSSYGSFKNCYVLKMGFCTSRVWV